MRGALRMSWPVVLAMLAGDPLPPLPPIAGRLIKAPVPTDADPVAEAWDAATAATNQSHDEAT